MSDTLTLPTTTAQSRSKPVLAPLYHVILLNDDDHSFEYVIEMLAKIFGHPAPTGFKMAWEVHSSGRAIVVTTHRELAELRQEQIHAFGPDRHIQHCKGSMSAAIEPAS